MTMIKLPLLTAIVALALAFGTPVELKRVQLGWCYRQKYVKVLCKGFMR